MSDDEIRGEVIGADSEPEDYTVLHVKVPVGTRVAHTFVAIRDIDPPKSTPAHEMRCLPGEGAEWPSWEPVALGDEEIIGFLDTKGHERCVVRFPGFAEYRKRPPC